MDFRILGPVEVRLDGRSLELSGGQKTLLARLLLEPNRIVPTERLIDQLWPVAPESGVKALQVRVSELRRALGDREAAVITRDPGYLVEVAANGLDLGRFEALTTDGEKALSSGRPTEAVDLLREALELWRGQPLGGATDAPFVSTARARLDELRLGAREKRIEADLALGRHAQVIAELEELSAENSFREGFHAQLMLALYRAGRQADALATYQRARTALVGELGIAPGRALQELEQAVLRHDPSLDIEPTTAASRAEQTDAQTAAERSILVVPHERDNIDQLVAIAEPMTRRPRREIILAELTNDSGELDTIATQLEARRQALLDRGVAARAAAFTSASAGSDLARLSAKQDVDLLLTDAPGDFLADGLPPTDLRTLLDEAPCDIATLVTSEGDAAAADGDIAVPFGGGYHEWSALEIGAWLALSCGATLRLLGTEEQPERGKRDASGMLADVSLIVQRATGLAARPQLVPLGQEAIIAASSDARLLIVGLSERWPEEGLGTARLALARGARPPILVVRRGVRPGGMAPMDRLTRYTWSLAQGDAAG